MDITDEVLAQFKQRMKISHHSEDDNLKQLLSSSYFAVKSSCGSFGLDHKLGMELVFERARYAYNDSLEYFTQNFLNEIINLALVLGIQKSGDTDGD